MILTAACILGICVVVAALLVAGAIQETREALLEIHGCEDPDDVEETTDRRVS